MTENQFREQVNSFIKGDLQNLYGLDIAVKDQIEDESSSDFNSTEELIKHAVGLQIYLHFDRLREEEEDGMSADDDYDIEAIVQEEMDKYIWWLAEDGLVWDDMVKKDLTDTLDPSQMTHTERRIASSLQSFDNFIISSREETKVEELAECFAYTTIPVKLDSLEVLRGKRKIYSYGQIKYFDYECDWAEPIINHPDKKFYVLFKISAETDSKLISKLSSYLDAHAIGGGSVKCDNFRSALLYDGDGSNIPASIKSLCPGEIL